MCSRKDATAYDEAVSNRLHQKIPTSAVQKKAGLVGRLSELAHFSHFALGRIISNSSPRPYHFHTNDD